jgi:cytochrome c-type biogenesis protein CcmH
VANKLRSRLTESPEDLEGWVLLARTLKTMQRYPEALDALETARRIAPEDPYVAVELVEARIFLSGDGVITSEMVSMLQQALTQDPAQQKALWLMGIAATQAGEDEAAISYWETLLELLEPGSTAVGSVQAQIDQARQRMGVGVGVGVGTGMGQAAPPIEETPPEPAAESGSWPGTTVRLTAGGALSPEQASGAILYVMIRTPGPAVGPPIGVRRISAPVLPLEITISDQDSMMQDRLISSQTEVQIQARLSLSGSPAARSGDWQSSKVSVPLNSTAPVELLIDQQVE